MKKPTASITVVQATKPTKAEVIARLIARAELDYGCCGHSKPASK